MYNECRVGHESRADQRLYFEFCWDFREKVIRRSFSSTASDGLVRSSSPPPLQKQKTSGAGKINRYTLIIIIGRCIIRRIEYKHNRNMDAFVFVNKRR